MRPALALSSLALLQGLGCSPDPPAVCVGFDAGPEVSGKVSRADANVVVARSCSLPSCHGTRPGTGLLYLPPPASGDWYKEVVNVPARRAPTLMRVRPGDPAGSFLVQKIVGSGLCTLGKVCEDGCGGRMPKDNEPLPDADIRIIVEWVRAGAPES